MISPGSLAQVEEGTIVGTMDMKFTSQCPGQMIVLVISSGMALDSLGARFCVVLTRSGTIYYVSDRRLTALSRSPGGER